MQISLLNVIFGRCTAETPVTLNVSNPYTNKDETILQTKSFIAFLNGISGINCELIKVLIRIFGV